MDGSMYRQTDELCLALYRDDIKGWCLFDATRGLGQTLSKDPEAAALAILDLVEVRRSWIGGGAVSVHLLLRDEGRRSHPMAIPFISSLTGLRHRSGVSMVIHHVPFPEVSDPMIETGGAGNMARVPEFQYRLEADGRHVAYIGGARRWMGPTTVATLLPAITHAGEMRRRLVDAGRLHPAMPALFRLGIPAARHLALNMEQWGRGSLNEALDDEFLMFKAELGGQE